MLRLNLNIIEMQSVCHIHWLVLLKGLKATKHYAIHYIFARFCYTGLKTGDTGKTCLNPTSFQRK